MTKEEAETHRSTIDLSAFGPALPGEDRQFGGDAFYVDLTPYSTHFTSLRACLTASDWKAISKYVIQRAGRKCEICGSEEKLEAHERWRLNIETKRQDVIRLLCVCKKCHLGIHHSLAGIIGMRSEIDGHIMVETGWDKETLAAHIKERTRTYHQLSKHEHMVDLGMFEKIGIIPRTPDDRAKRVTAARTYAGIFDNTEEGQAAMEKRFEHETRKFDERHKTMMTQPSRQQRKKG